MHTRGKQVAAGVLGLNAVVVGVWAAAAPRSFFSSFPLPGHHWVAPLGPYDEHVTRDVGGLYLSLFVVSAWAAIRPRRETLAVAALAWLVFSIPHLVYHCLHLDVFSFADALGNVVTLGGTVVLAALLVLPNDQHVVGSSTGRDHHARAGGGPERQHPEPVTD